MLTILLWVLVLLIVLTFVLSSVLFRMLFSRPKRSKDVPESYVGTPHYKVSRAGMALMDEMNCVDLMMTNREGLQLHAYLYPSETGTNNKKFIVGMHGYRSYARPEYGPYIAFYHALGYSMVLPDERAHGASAGQYIGLGVLDRLDCVDWVRYLVHTYGPNTEVLLHGVSMGAAAVLGASGEAGLPKQVRGIVADCSYTSVYDEFCYQFRHTLHLPRFPILGLLERLAVRKAGYDFQTYSPIRQVQKATVPILFVHGGKDTMVPPHMVQELYAACGAPKQLLVVPEAGHAESIALAPEEYHQAIHQLFGI